MKYRKDIDFTDEKQAEGYVNEIEDLVNNALDLLDNILKIEDLSNIEDCRDILKEIVTAIY